MFHFIPEANVPESFSGYTLIVPSVSIGNVGQLCVDLYISSLQCRKIGFLWHASIMPMVGGDAFRSSSQSLTTSSELYIDEKHKLLFVQIRSPVLKTRLQDFLISLVNWVRKSNILQIIVLTGSTSLSGSRDVIEGKKLRYAFTQDLIQENVELLNVLKWSPIKDKSETDILSSHNQDLFPGGGLANQLLALCEEEHIRAGVLVKFCSEGDNIPDACDLAEYLNQWLHVINSKSGEQLQWIYPFSWKYMFGKLPSNALY